jgi:Holliday junction DNA helicase RuvA
MLAFISGKIVHKSGDNLVIRTASGLGYLVQVATNSNFLVNENIELFLYNSVNRENQQELFGFEDFSLREWMIKLIQVPGVGPKMGATIVFALGNKIGQILRQGELEALQEIKGLGGKTAKKILLEFQGKDFDMNNLSNNNPFALQFSESLKNIGYKQSEIVTTITQLKTLDKWDEQNLAETLRWSLKLLSKK